MLKFYEKYWSGNKNVCAADFSSKWPKLKKFIPLGKGVAIVDFGCGNGKILQEIRKLNQRAKYIGLDVSGEALKIAVENNPDCKFYKIEDGGRLPLGDDSVDFAFSSEVIEHIYDTENALSEISRILKPNGKLLLTTPYHGLVKNFLIVLHSFDHHFNPAGSHIRFFSKRSLFGLLGKFNFTIETCGYYGRFYPISKSIYVLAKKI